MLLLGVYLSSKIIYEECVICVVQGGIAQYSTRIIFKLLHCAFNKFLTFTQLWLFWHLFQLTAGVPTYSCKLSCWSLTSHPPLRGCSFALRRQSAMGSVAHVCYHFTRLTSKSLLRGLIHLIHVCERAVVRARVCKRKSSLSPWRRCHGRTVFLLFLCVLFCLQQLIGNSIYIL